MRAISMTNSLDPTARQDVLHPDLLARLQNMMVYLQLPEGGVKTAFPDEISCRDRFIAIRWPDGVCCPACGDHSVNMRTFSNAASAGSNSLRHPGRSFIGPDYPC